jgi:hypothetical protein
MDGEKDLRILLSSMEPELADEDYAFCATGTALEDLAALGPWAVVREKEGITAILETGVAKKNGIPFHSTFKRITLTVHSSLDAVGLTAAVSTRLAESGISANVVAAFYHDHVFVQEGKAQEALALLRELARENLARA